jgi:hypothetical protein
MDVSGHHAPPTVSLGKNPYTDWIRGWVGLGAFLDTLEKRKSLVMLGFEPRTIHPIALSLYWPQYPSSPFWYELSLFVNKWNQHVCVGSKWNGESLFTDISFFVILNMNPLCSLTRHGRASGEAESLYCEEDAIDGSSGPERRVSNEFSPLTVHQHLDHLSSNLKDLFGDGSRKGSSSNLQPRDESGTIVWSLL